MAKIHSTALIDKKAEIHDDVEIGPYSIIGAGVKLGKGCWVGSHVEMKGNTEIGENNKFFHACIIGEIPQDTTFNNPEAKVKIGNNNTFREFSNIHQPSKAGNLTV